MLNSESLLVVENRVAQDLEDRRSAFAHEVGQLWAKMSAKGVLFSGMTVAQTLDAIGNEFRVRVSLIWHAFARAFDAKKMVISEEIASEVKQRLADLWSNALLIFQHSTRKPYS